MRQTQTTPKNEPVSHDRKPSKPNTHISKTDIRKNSESISANFTDSPTSLQRKTVTHMKTTKNTNSKMVKGERRENPDEMDFNSYRRLTVSPTKSLVHSVMSSRFKEEAQQSFRKQQRVNILKNYQDEYGKTMKFMDEKVLR